MNQPSSLQPPQFKKQSVPELPHLVVEEHKRGALGIFGIVILSLMFLAIPVGIFLVSRPTQLKPQAAVEEKLPDLVAGLFLESKLSLDSERGIIPVDIYVKSPGDQINLVNAKLNFDPNLVMVDKIATGAAELGHSAIFNQWIEASFDNNKGNVSVIAGLPTPGLKTGSPNDEQVYLATVHLKPKNTGTAVLQVSPESQILRNSDNNNTFKTGNDLVLNLAASVSEATSAAKTNKKIEESLIVLTSPVSGTNYSYFQPLNIAWSSFNVDRIMQINLYINGELFGAIGQNMEAAIGKFDWRPQDTLSLPYIQLTNTFEVEVVGVSKDGNLGKVRSGPFGILGTEQITGAPPSLESFAQNQLNVTDVSRTLSNYLVLPLKDASLDLNKDGVVNALDLFLIRENLLLRGVIK